MCIFLVLNRLFWVWYWFYLLEINLAKVIDQLIGRKRQIALIDNYKYRELQLLTFFYLLKIIFSFLKLFKNPFLCRWGRIPSLSWPTMFKNLPNQFSLQVLFIELDFQLEWYVQFTTVHLEALCNQEWMCYPRVQLSFVIYFIFFLKMIFRILRHKQLEEILFK